MSRFRSFLQAVALVVALALGSTALALVTGSPAAAQAVTPLSCAVDNGVVSWSGGAADASKYWIYRSTDGGGIYKWLGGAPADTNVLVDPAARPGVLYQVHQAGSPRSDCSTTSEPAPASCSGGTLEAEDALVVGRFVADSDASASGGAYAAVPRGTGGDWLGAGISFVEFCATVDELGEYQIDARVLAPSSVKRSFYVSVDDGYVAEFVAPAVVGSYQTVAVNDAPALDPLLAGNQGRPTISTFTWTLEPGDHFIRFAVRRDGVRLDNITLRPVTPSESPSEDDECLGCDEVRAVYEALPVAAPAGPVCGWPSVICFVDEFSDPELVIGVSLANLGLTELPPEIGDLANLIVLNLGQNQLASLPPEIGNLANLTDLNLFNNQLTTLPAEIGNLTGLTDLTLFQNKLTSLPPGIGELTQLTELEVERNELTTLPAEIGNLTNLQIIKAYENELVSLPAEIGDMTALWNLRLNDNQLTDLPPEITSVSNLRNLELERNQLDVIPPVIFELTNLTSLQLDGNSLTTVPPDIGDLTKLAALGLGRNQVTELPAEIGNLGALRFLTVSGNRLTALPPEIGQLMNLEQFYVGYNGAGNELTTIPVEIGELVRLENLYLEDNQIRGDITVLAPLFEASLVFLFIADGEGGNDCLTTTSVELAAQLDATDQRRFVGAPWDRCDNP